MLFRNIKVGCCGSELRISAKKWLICDEGLKSSASAGTGDITYDAAAVISRQDRVFL